jgi:uncharacterized membrane protein
MMPMMSSSGWATMWIFLLLLVLAVGVGVFALASTVARSGGQPAAAGPPAQPAERSQPEETLCMRYAHGEIDTDEFQRRHAALQGARQAPDPDL